MYYIQTAMNRPTCIIVEDDIDFQDLLKRNLERIGLVDIVGTYTDSVQASVQIEKQKPDIIFLDINISGLEGPDFLEMVQHKASVIVISGYSEDIMDDYNIAYSAFLQKPFTHEKLKSAIEKALLK